MTKSHIEPTSKQKNQVAIVTGANSGVGFATSLALAKNNFQVILACRNIEKANHAKKVILKEYTNAKIDIIALDLSNLSSVRNFTDIFLSRYNSLHLLINNAGIMMPPFSLTNDGLESQMATNYFGHFLLTGLLLDVLNQSNEARIINLSSIAHKSGKINFEDINSQQKYSAWNAYAQSKLACLIFSYELNRRLKNSKYSTISVAAHPGVSTTNITQHYPKFISQLFHLFGPLFSQKPKNAALPILHAALDKTVKGGEYFGPNGIGEMKGNVGKAIPSQKALNQEVAQQLWSLSEKLTNFKYTTI